MQVFTVFALSLAMVQATPLNIYNQCSENIQLYDNSATETIASGGSTTRLLSAGFNGMFRNGVGSQATLAEFSITGGYTWYDISIIPTGSTGPGSCSSLENCKAVTEGTGFNTAMQIAPSGCATVTCMEDGCADAYQYPSDDAKTHSCADTAPIDLIFCPSGTATAPTPAPESTSFTPTPTTQAPTAAPTPEPTTQPPTAAPTPVPTTQAPAPVPTTEPPVLTTQAPTSMPSTEAPTPIPTIATPKPSTADRTLEPDLETSESTTGSASYNSSSSSSVDTVSAEDATIAVSPETKSTTIPTTSGGSGTEETISTKTQSSGTSLSSVLVGVVGALVVVAAIVAVVAMRRKKRQLKAMKPKESDSVYSYAGMLTPRSDIGVLDVTDLAERRRDQVPGRTQAESVKVLKAVNPSEFARHSLSNSPLTTSTLHYASRSMRFATLQMKFIAFGIAALVAEVKATSLIVYNQCGGSIDLYDNSATETVASGGSTSRTLSSGFSGMFRNGASAQATLAEFSITGGYTWYDISIIPTGTTGPGSCLSLADCKSVTGGTGFNTPMQIAPAGCATVTCLEDGCADAYQYPSDDAKTHSCIDTAPVSLIFCPGGITASTSAAPETSSSTSTPTAQTPSAAPVPEPTTPAPTAVPSPVPTTQAPTAAPSPVPTTQVSTPAPSTEPPTPVLVIQASTPVPSTEAPTPVPATEAPTPIPISLTPKPTSEAPTPVPTTETPPGYNSTLTSTTPAATTPVPEVATPAPMATSAEVLTFLIPSATDASSSSDSSGSSLSSSSSTNGDTIIFPPEESTREQTATTAATSIKSIATTPTSDGSSGPTVTTAAASSGASVGTIVASTVGAAAIIAAVAAIVMVRRRKRQMEAASPKDDLEWLDGYAGVKTPVSRIATF